LNSRGGGTEYSPRFYEAIAEQQSRMAEREELMANKPVCCCHKEGEIITIDGEKFRCLNRIDDAGCRVHNPLETHFISRLATPAAAAAEHRQTHRAKGSFVRSDS
jgi:hypothetical protein